MPYEVLVDRTGDTHGAPETSGAPSSSDLLLHIRLTPHQSLSPEGFVTFVGITFVMMLVPLSALIGTVLWWGIAPYILGALGLLWYMLKRSWKDGTLSEDLRLWPERITIDRMNPRAEDQHWEANPYWVSLHVHTKPVEHYLTLKGSDREVELGRFLSPEERQVLDTTLRAALNSARLAE